MIHIHIYMYIVDIRLYNFYYLASSQVLRAYCVCLCSNETSFHLCAVSGGKIPLQCCPKTPRCSAFIFFLITKIGFLCATRMCCSTPLPTPPIHTVLQIDSAPLSVCLSVAQQPVLFWLHLDLYLVPSCSFFWGRHLIELTATGTSFLPSSDSFLSPLSALQNPCALMKLG